MDKINLRDYTLKSTWRFILMMSKIKRELDKINKDTMICGLCRFYDSDMCFCSRHLNWGELVEMDSCSDYEELP